MIKFLNILIIALLIWYLNKVFTTHDQESVNLSEQLITEEKPDYYTENVKITQYDRAGNLQSVITSKLLAHYNKQQVSVLESPHLSIYAIDGLTKRIHANQAVIEDQSKDILMEDEVELLMTDAEDSRKFSINTTELFYRVEQRVLETSKQVLAKNSLGKYQSEGLMIDLKNNQFDFLKDLKIQYDVN